MPAKVRPAIDHESKVWALTPSTLWALSDLGVVIVTVGYVGEGLRQSQLLRAVIRLAALEQTGHLRHDLSIYKPASASELVISSPDSWLTPGIRGQFT